MLKTNFRNGSLAIAALLLVACEDDSSANANEVDAATTEATDAPNNENTSEPEETPASETGETTETDPATVPREGPEGCYMSETHVCDCDLDEAECDEVSGIWTDGCNSCAAAEPDAGETTEPSNDDAGSSRGDAGTAPSDAGAPSSDASTPPGDTGTALDDAGTPQADAGSDAGHSVEPSDAGSGNAALACYLPEAHLCDCAADEAQCTVLNGIWTEGCGCSSDAGNP